jgi:hypothetical protein
VLPINTSIELSITLKISTRSTACSEIITESLPHFLTKSFPEHPVDDFLHGFPFLAEKAVLAKRLARSQSRLCPAHDGNERILLRQPTASP